MNVDEAMAVAKRRHQAGDLAGAEALYRQVLAVRPEQAEALNMLGLVALQAGDAGAAIALMERSVQLAGDVYFFHNNLAEAYKAAGRWEDAAVALRRSLALRAEQPEITHSYGVALERAGDAERAMGVLRGAIARWPGLAIAHMSLGAMLDHAGRYDEAMASYERAVGLDPNYARARAGRAGIWLRRGDFERGWREYEARWQVARFPGRRPRAGVTMWDGSPLEGRRIMLYAEQGLGDTIQFVRFATAVAAERGAGRVIVECAAPLVRLVRSVRGVAEVVTPDEPPPPYDRQLPMMSLPRVLGTRVETIPAAVPYVAPPADVAAAWRARVEADGGGAGPRVGICWAVGRTQTHRTMPAPAVAALVAAAPAGVRFYSLQKERPADGGGLPAGVIDHMGAVTDFADTAGLIGMMDLVICVDTSVTHVAGAMGKPTWVMLPREADWRWLEGRADSPWYPTVRLFRQGRAGDWGEVVGRVGGELGRWVGGRGRGE